MVKNTPFIPFLSISSPSSAQETISFLAFFSWLGDGHGPNHYSFVSLCRVHSVLARRADKDSTLSVGGFLLLVSAWAARDARNEAREVEADEQDEADEVRGYDGLDGIEFVAHEDVGAGEVVDLIDH